MNVTQYMLGRTTLQKNQFRGLWVKKNPHNFPCRNSWPSRKCKPQIASNTTRRQVGDIITEKWKILDIFLRGQ